MFVTGSIRFPLTVIASVHVKCINLRKG